MKFSHLILRKIIKFLATRCQILRLKCTKFNFGWGSSPDSAGGAHSAPPDILAGLKGPRKGYEIRGRGVERVEREGKERGRRRGEGRERKGGEGKGWGTEGKRRGR